jgi:myo-inositol-1(or 4)-monophosphatase
VQEEQLKIDQEFLEETLELSGQKLSMCFGTNLDVRVKPDAGIVTNADYESEKIILDRIMRYFPEDAIISEESGIHRLNRRPGQRVWIVDPLDGTTNFANNYPFFCVSIGACRIATDGTFDMELAGIEEPSQNVRYLAGKGKGAWMNGQPMKVALERPFGQTFLVTGFSYKTGGDLMRDLKTFSNVAEKCQSIRRDGAAALDLAYVARGIFDAFWESGLQIWDMAAGALLVKEAGGFLSNYSPNTSNEEDFNLEGFGVMAGVEKTVKELSGILNRRENA